MFTKFYINVIEVFGVINLIVISISGLVGKTAIDALVLTKYICDLAKVSLKTSNGEDTLVQAMRDCFPCSGVSLAMAKMLLNII